MTCEVKHNAADSIPGRLAAEVELDARGAPELRLAHEGRPVIRSAALVLRTGAGALCEGLKAAGCETAEIDERYSLPAGKLAEYACRACRGAPRPRVGQRC